MTTLPLLFDLSPYQILFYFQLHLCLLWLRVNQYHDLPVSDKINSVPTTFLTKPILCSKVPMLRMPWHISKVPLLRNPNLGFIRAFKRGILQTWISTGTETMKGQSWKHILYYISQSECFNFDLSLFPCQIRFKFTWKYPIWKLELIMNWGFKVESLMCHCLLKIGTLLFT